MQLKRTVLVDQPVDLLFDVIEAAEFYPRFLPWCAGATILQRDDQLVAAELQVRWHGLDFSFRTRNPKRRPEHMLIQLEQGPFRHFHGEWQLTPLAPDACKVVFLLDVDWAGSLVSQLSGPLFAQVTGTLVDAFVQRAHSLAAASAVSMAAVAPATAAATAATAPTNPPSTLA